MNADQSKPRRPKQVPVKLRLEWAAERARSVQASIQAAVDCPLCPEMTPERGIEVLGETSSSKGNLMGLGRVSGGARERAEALAADEAWRALALEWATGFWAQHGHGPTWKQFRTGEFWPAELPLWRRAVTMTFLYRSGYLDGTRTPFGLKVRVEPTPRGQQAQ